MSEKEELQAKLNELEEQSKPIKERLREIYIAESKAIEERVRDAKHLKASFALDELIFAATARCSCGAGLAYPKNVGMHGAWTCSDILLGRAKPKGDPESKMHDGDLPFAFYEVKSENQPSAGGATTRPKTES